MTTALPEPNLSALYQLLSQQALVAMGVALPGLDKPPPAEPALARFLVDLLGVVQEKTEGRRTDQESQELEALLYHLRLKIVELRKAGIGER